jgi:hypothetical protein
MRAVGPSILNGDLRDQVLVDLDQLVDVALLFG